MKELWYCTIFEAEQMSGNVGAPSLASELFHINGPTRVNSGLWSVPYSLVTFQIKPTRRVLVEARRTRYVMRVHDSVFTG